MTVRMFIFLETAHLKTFTSVTYCDGSSVVAKIKAGKKDIGLISNEMTMNRGCTIACAARPKGNRFSSLPETIILNARAKENFNVAYRESIQAMLLFSISFSPP